MSELMFWKDKEMRKLEKDVEDLLFRFCCDFGLPCAADELSLMPSISIADHTFWRLEM
jgi:hypothetical protein